MKYPIKLAIAMLLFGTLLISSCSEDGPPGNDKTDTSMDFPSSSAIPGFCTPSIDESGTSASAAAQVLIASVGSNGLVFSFDASQKYTWSVLPVPVVVRTNQGARMGDLTAEQITLVCNLLDAAFPNYGIGAISGCMSSDQVLGEESNRSDREYTKDNYWVSIFGDPAGTGKWAFQIEGHHLAVNVAVKGNDIVVGPFLFGGSPLRDESGVPLLDEQINAMIEFAGSIRSDQESTFVTDDTPPELDAESKNQGSSFPEPSSTGLRFSDLDVSQQLLLREVLNSFFAMIPEDYRIAKKNALEGVINSAIISWQGPLDAKPFGFQFRSDLLHIIWSGEDDPDHVHCFIRFPGDDYGVNL